MMVKDFWTQTLSSLLIRFIILGKELTSLNLSFLICEVGMSPSSEGYWEKQLHIDTGKVIAITSGTK